MNVALDPLVVILLLNFSGLLFNSLVILDVFTSNLNVLIIGSFHTLKGELSLLCGLCRLSPLVSIWVISHTFRWIIKTSHIHCLLRLDHLLLWLGFGFLIDVLLVLFHGFRVSLCEGRVFLFPMI